MNLKIFGETLDVEKPVYLRLVRQELGGIALMAVDKTGTPVFCGNILFFNSDGTIERAQSVNSDLGFQRDGNRAVVIRGVS